MSEKRQVKVEVKVKKGFFSRVIASLLKAGVAIS